jgi:hypothetical protein
LYSSQQKNRTISMTNAPPTSVSELSIILNRNHRQN